jgi:hypothetical protein
MMVGVYIILRSTMRDVFDMFIGINHSELKLYMYFKFIYG